MNKTIQILFLVLVFAGIQTLSAQQARVTQAEAELVARNFIANIIGDDVLIKEISTVSDNLIYRVTAEKAVIFVSGHKAAPPVLGVGIIKKNSNLDYPLGLNLLIESWTEQLQVVVQEKIIPTKKTLSLWEKFTKSSIKQKEDIVPMLNTTWNQGCYYNSAFPIDSSGSCFHPYTGCVATALSQIMKFYNFPVSGTGSNSINSPYGMLEVNFGEANYQWQDMENNLTDENEAVAELLFHTAIAVDSQFLPGGTGAYDVDARDALIDYFNYKESAELIWRDAYAGDWSDLLKNELNKDRPVIYGAIDQENLVGHTFIVDGLFNENLFHINWGWGGSYNGYFYLDTLVAGPYHFNIQHDMIAGIYPDIPDTLTLYAPQNLQASANMRDIVLTWNQPQAGSTLEHIGYHVFRNDTLLNHQMIVAGNFLDEDVPPGDHSYQVVSSFVGKNIGPGISSEVYVSSITQPIVGHLKIFPNPVKDRVMINTGMLPKNATLQISDLTGKEIYHKQLNGNPSGKTTINLSIPNGIYLIMINSTEYMHSEKLIIAN